MGLRDRLLGREQAELRSCVAYGTQQRNFDSDSATQSATPAQQPVHLHRSGCATQTATPAQHTSCAPLGIEDTNATVAQRASDAVALADAAEVSWSDADITRFLQRKERLIRWGRSEEEAERIAERLVRRDRDGDDRRMCVECSFLGNSGRCIAAATGRLKGVDRRLEPVPDILQRCEAFGERKGVMFIGAVQAAEEQQ
jgi:hypothetical protein